MRISYSPNQSITIGTRRKIGFWQKVFITEYFDG